MAEGMLIGRAGHGWMVARTTGPAASVYFRCTPAANNRLIITSVILQSPNGVKASTLRGLAIARLEAAINAPGRARDWALKSAAEPDDVLPLLGPAPSAPRRADRTERARLERPGREGSDLFYVNIAKAYSDLVTSTSKPAVAIAEEADVPVATARRWIHEARRRGLLPPGRQGKAQ